MHGCMVCTACGSKEEHHKLPRAGLSHAGAREYTSPSCGRCFREIKNYTSVARIIARWAGELQARLEIWGTARLRYLSYLRVCGDRQARPSHQTVHFSRLCKLDSNGAQ